MVASAPSGRLSTILIDFDTYHPSTNAMITEPWVTAEDVAQHLGVAKDTVYRWRERKGLPAHRVGRLWKFQLSEVDEWVRAGGADEEKMNDSTGTQE
jgi:excisionase family DNA binding protein